MINYDNAFKGIDRQYSKEIDMTKLNRNINWWINSAKQHKKMALRYSYKRSQEKCPICDGIKYQKFVTIYDYDYLQCLECGHIYLRDLIDEQDVKKLYGGGENKNLQHTVYLNEELYNKRVKQIAEPKVQWISSKIKKRKGFWIDIGCGTGEILSAAKNLGYEVMGIDSDEKEVEFANSKGIDVICDYINESNAHKYLKYLNKVNVLSFFNILEHLEKPKTFLKAIINNVSKGAYVAIEVPRHPSISSLSNLVFNYVTCRHICPPDHIHIFTEKSMEILIKEAGLNPVSIWTFGQDVYEFLMASLSSNNIQENDFIEYIIKSIPKLQKSVDKVGLSDTMIVLCNVQ